MSKITLFWMNKLRELMKQNIDSPKDILKAFYAWGEEQEIKINNSFKEVHLDKKIRKVLEKENERKNDTNNIQTVG